MSEGNSQVISCKKLHALVLPRILEEAESSDPDASQSLGA